MATQFKDLVNWLTNNKLKEKSVTHKTLWKGKMGENAKFPLYVIGIYEPFGSRIGLFVVQQTKSNKSIRRIINMTSGTCVRDLRWFWKKIEQ